MSKIKIFTFGLLDLAMGIGTGWAEGSITPQFFQTYIVVVQVQVPHPLVFSPLEVKMIPTPLLVKGRQNL